MNQLPPPGWKNAYYTQDPQKMVVKDYWGRHVNATDFVVADRPEGRP